MLGRAGKETENDAQECLQNPPSLASLFDWLDCFNLKQFLLSSTNVPAFFCGFGIYLTLHFLGSCLGVFFRARLWKCDIWIAEFFEFYTSRTYGM
jgi:hypothetical protein